MIEGPEDQAWLRNATVLYVEDDADTRELTGQFLRRRAGTLVTAADGVEGLAAFRACRAPIVVTDILMPNLDGLAMAEAIREIDPAVLVIVTTAFERLDFLSRSVAAGVAHYVLKPVQSERLEFALLSCAQRHRLGGRPQPAAEPAPAGLAKLTRREQDVLARIGQGLPSVEIGRLLGISSKTVDTHVAHMMIKLEVHKATALAAIAVRAGLA